MKATIAIITNVILFIAFQQEPLTKVGTIKLPNSRENVELGQIRSFEKANFKYPSSTKNLQHIYKLCNVLFGFQDYTRPIGYDVSLEGLRDRMVGEVEEIEARKTKEIVDIVKYNNTKFLIRKAIRDDECNYYFISESRAGLGIKGGIQFKKADQQKAETILNDFLKNFQFKK
ncbi:hypothetical protein SAMN05421820_10269 [Pedobacter steynii]|uniref:Uncharacterized protein n=1 Tax=Pedobacter steynii TaxID=430522 RepID=A0A1G9MNB2_9SPHI|nr:hypothetical protein [Pedobacter steynii]NQX39546.1 hypothetical protein [Pedobacter steynii]SDL75762.1 hypothetical protein SAMN05421820_10269 [Pedobacter steynii]